MKEWHARFSVDFTAAKTKLALFAFAVGLFTYDFAYDIGHHEWFGALIDGTGIALTWQSASAAYKRLP